MHVLMTAPAPLSPQVRADMEASAAALGATRDAFEKLQCQLTSADGIGSAKIAQLKLEAQHERAALVTSALESLRHLRSHLVTALSGLREVSCVERERTRPSTTPGQAFSSPRALEPSQLGAQEEVRGGLRRMAPPDGPPCMQVLTTAPHPYPQVRGGWPLRLQGGLPNHMVIRVELPLLCQIRSPRPRVLHGLSYEGVSWQEPPRALHGGRPRAKSSADGATVVSPLSACAALGQTPPPRLARQPAALAENEDLLAPEPLGRDDAVALRPFTATSPHPPVYPRSPAQSARPATMDLGV